MEEKRERSVEIKNRIKLICESIEKKSMNRSRWKIHKRKMVEAQQSYDMKHTHTCANPNCTSLK